jgi:hypothetical protein
MADDTVTAISAEIRSNAGKFYVYVLSYPSGDPFYVGCGKAGKYHPRILDHEKLAVGEGKQRKSLKSHIIRKIMRDGGTVGKAIDSWHLSLEAMFAREIDLIGGIGRRDLGRGPLANGNDGGTGQFNPTKETRAKIGAGHIGRWTDDVRRENRERALKNLHSPEAKLKHRVACADPEWRAKRSVAQKERLKDPEVKKIMRSGIEAALKDPEYRSRLSQIRTAQFAEPEARQLASENQAIVWTDPEYREKAEENCREMGRIRWSKPGARERQSAKQKAAWTPERRAKQSEMMRKIRETKKWS